MLNCRQIAAWRYILGVLLLSALAPAYADPAADTWSSSISRATQSRFRGQQSAAEAQLKDAQKLALLPYSKFETYRLLAYIYKEEKKNDLAEAELKHCLDLGKNFDYLKGEGIEDDLATLYDETGNKSQAELMHHAASESDKQFAGTISSLAPFVSRLQGAVKSQWLLANKDAAPPATKNKAICNWLVDKSGKFTLVHLTSSSGDDAFDKSAISVISKMAAFEPLPINAPEFVEIQFFFDPAKFLGR